MKRQYLLTSASMHMVENPYTISGFTFIDFVFTTFSKIWLGGPFKSSLTPGALIVQTEEMTLS